MDRPRCELCGKRAAIELRDLKEIKPAGVDEYPVYRRPLLLCEECDRRPSDDMDLQILLSRREV